MGHFLADAVDEMELVPGAMGFQIGQNIKRAKRREGAEIIGFEKSPALVVRILNTFVLIRWIYDDDLHEERFRKESAKAGLRKRSP